MSLVKCGFTAVALGLTGALVGCAGVGELAPSAIQPAAAPATETPQVISQEPQREPSSPPEATPAPPSAAPLPPAGDGSPIPGFSAPISSAASESDSGRAKTAVIVSAVNALFSTCIGEFPNLKKTVDKLVELGYARRGAGFDFQRETLSAGISITADQSKTICYSAAETDELGLFVKGVAIGMGRVFGESFSREDRPDKTIWRLDKPGFVGSYVVVSRLMTTTGETVTVARFFAPSSAATGLADL